MITEFNGSDVEGYVEVVNTPHGQVSDLPTSNTFSDIPVINTEVLGGSSSMKAMYYANDRFIRDGNGDVILTELGLVINA